MKKKNSTGRNRKKPSKKTTNSTKKPIFRYGSLVFWLAFACVIILLFVINRGRIERTIADTRLKEKILGVETSKEAETPSGGRPVDTKEPNVKILDDEGGRRTPQTDLPEGSPAPQDGNFPLLEDEIAALSRTDGQNAAQGAQDPQSATENARVERSLYFMGMNADGLLFRKAVRRQFKVSASPLQEVLTALLGGVTPAEKQGGFDTLIPPGTMLLNARIRGGTAELSFSEEFMFNPYGAEGYLGQITQIVWTVTEFPNITEVQFLVEGQKIPYLGDSIRLGAPISRGMLD